MSSYIDTWRQRQRDRYISRESTARNRCQDCKVEVCRGALNCRNCGERRAKARRESAAVHV